MREKNTNLTGLRNSLATVIAAREKRSNDKEQIDAKNEALKKKTAEEKTVAAVASECKKRLQEASDLYDRQKATVDDWAKNIRSSLKVGDTCPVCNRIIDMPLPSEKDFEALVRPVEEALEKAGRENDIAIENLLKFQAEIKVMTADLDRSRKLYESDKSLADAETAFAKALKTAGLDNSGNLDEKIEKEITSNETRMNEASKKLGVCAKLQKDINSLTSEISSMQKRKDAVASRIVAVEKKIADSRSGIKSTLEMLESDMDDFKRSIDEIVSSKPEWVISDIKSRNPQAAGMFAGNMGASEIRSAFSSISSSICAYDAIIAENRKNFPKMKGFSTVILSTAVSRLDTLRTCHAFNSGISCRLKRIAGEGERSSPKRKRRWQLFPDSLKTGKNRTQPATSRRMKRKRAPTLSSR